MNETKKGMAKCRSCGAEIKFISTPAGKPMPIDPAPIRVIVPRGNDPSTGDIVTGYQSHFSTCPNASSHRKPAPKGDASRRQMKLRERNKMLSYLSILKGSVCQCGLSKDPLKPFCRRCFLALPDALRVKVSSLRINHGFEDAYDEALKIIKGG